MSKITRSNVNNEITSFLTENRRKWTYRDGWALEESYVSTLRDSREARGDNLIKMVDYISARSRAFREDVSLLINKGERVLPLETPSGSLAIRHKMRAGCISSYLVERERGRAGAERIIGIACSETLNEIGYGNEERISAWINSETKTRQFFNAYTKSLKVLGIEIPNTEGGSAYQQAVSIIEGTIDALLTNIVRDIERFIAADQDLHQLGFEFNADRQPARYMSIICRFEVDRANPLGPHDFGFRVITNIHRITRKRQTKDLVDFKVSMKKKQVSTELEASQGYKPTSAQLREALSGERDRKPSRWITSQVLGHCWLGNQKTAILKQQQKIKATYETWLTLRNRLEWIYQNWRGYEYFT